MQQTRSPIILEAFINDDFTILRVLDKNRIFIRVFNRIGAVQATIIRVEQVRELAPNEFFYFYFFCLPSEARYVQSIVDTPKLRVAARVNAAPASPRRPDDWQVLVPTFVQRQLFTKEKK